MENPDDDNLVVIVVNFMHDDVRQPGHRPFVGAGHYADAPKLRKFAEPINLGEDARHDVGGGAWAAPLNIELDAIDVHERFKCEAHRHMVIRAIYL